MTHISQVPAASVDAHDELLAALADLVPSAFPDGTLDVGQLLAALGETNGLNESFAFTWPGIGQARIDARTATTTTLAPDSDASLNWDTARDVLIEGDNLQVLKLLKAGYSGSVKLIYIDPPYNTGDTFTYNDNYSVRENEYLRSTGQIDDQGNVTTSTLEKAGKKHAPWLSMMFPRLIVARHLLRSDGVILVSIDNNEVHHLRLLLDTVFGAGNFVDMMTWRGARKGDAKLTGGGQDYILIYARDREQLKKLDTRWREQKKGLDPIYAKVEELLQKHGDNYAAATEEMKAWYKTLADEDPSKEHEHYCRIEARGAYYAGDISSPNPRPNLVYDWKGYSIPDNGWRYQESKMVALDEDDRLIYPASQDKRITVKRFLNEHEEWAPPSVFYRDRRAASRELKDLMGAAVFDNPKNTDVLARLIHSLTDDGDLIVDFFAGSGSSGHAVWVQNATDGKLRHWVLVQAPEQVNRSEKTGSKALNAGFETIFDITTERLRRAAGTIDADSLGFRVFRTQESNLIVEAPIIAEEGMSGHAYIDETVSRALGSPVKDGCDDEAVAWELVIKATTMRLDSRMAILEMNGVTIYQFTEAHNDQAPRRLFVCLGAFTLAAADALDLGVDDTLILRGDKVDDATTLTLAPRLQNNLVLLERVAREVSL